MKRAVILLSGGADSCTLLAMIRDKFAEVYALSFSYRQNHVIELEKAKQIAANYNVTEHIVVDIDMEGFRGCSLIGQGDVPKYESASDIKDDVPSTYVPARNTIFLSYALGLAESFNAPDIFIAVHKSDEANYPDCRKEYIRAYEDMANLATKIGTSGGKIKIHTPLIEMTKADIVRYGIDAGVDYSGTISCYDPSPDGVSCGKCLSCRVRLDAFKSAGVKDPISYRQIV